MRTVRHSNWQRLGRLIRHRLIVPLLRSKHPPEHTARAVMVGLAWALTPTVGVQMILVLGTWLIARRVFRWDFNLVVACAWTWVSNVVTLVPCYYGFYLTGQLILGRFDDLLGYEGFAAAWSGDVQGMFSDWALPLVLGSLPWLIAGGWIGYRFGLAYARRRQGIRRARLAARMPRRAAASLQQPARQ